MRNQTQIQNPDLPNCVLGFFFSADSRQVLLILKTHPPFLAGLHNGIGGKCEPNEPFPAAMEREFEEETGIFVERYRWLNFCSMSVTSSKFKGTYTVECFKTIANSEEEFSSFRQQTDEQVKAFNVDNLPYFLVSNLKWMIPLALNGNIRKSSVIYQREE